MSLKCQEVPMSEGPSSLAGKFELAHSGCWVGSGLDFRAQGGLWEAVPLLQVRDYNNLDFGAWVLTVQLKSRRLVQERGRRQIKCTC